MCPPRPTDPSVDSHEAGVFRILDANLNRCHEGLRVVEEYLRFELEDTHLAGTCKQLRHDLGDVSRQVSPR